MRYVSLDEMYADEYEQPGHTKIVKTQMYDKIMHALREQSKQGRLPPWTPRHVLGELRTRHRFSE